MTSFFGLGMEKKNKLELRFKHETSKVKVLKNGYHSSSIVTAVLWSLDKGSFPHKDKPAGWILFWRQCLWRLSLDLGMEIIPAIFWWIAKIIPYVLNSTLHPSLGQQITWQAFVWCSCFQSRYIACFSWILFWRQCLWRLSLDLGMEIIPAIFWWIAKILPYVLKSTPVLP